MAFEFQQRAGKSGSQVALFPGAWNPPTTAHLAIAQAALAHVDEVVWVLPREMPHKTFHGAEFAARLEMLKQIAGTDDRFSVATSGAGLYIDIAREAAQLLSGSGIHLLCGRDAADRIATWNYGREGVFEEMLEEYPMLVAARAGHFSVAARHRHRITPLTMDGAFRNVSSSEIRARIAARREWRELVPAAIHQAVSILYA